MNKLQPFTPRKRPQFITPVDEMWIKIMRDIRQKAEIDAAIKAADDDVIIALKRALRMRGDDTQSGLYPCYIDFSDIAREGQKMTRQQVQALLALASLFKGIFTTDRPEKQVKDYLPSY